MPNVQVLHGDCVKLMREMPENSVDSIVTDPPYGLEFMGKDWDAPWKKRGDNPASAKFSKGGFESGNGYANRDTPSYGRAWSNNRCVKCGHIASGGSPCKCDNPEWVVERGDTAAPMRAFQEWFTEVAVEALRVLKPGGHLLSFGGTRTYHRMACAIEDAGFEIRDSIHWVYGSGFPKSLNVSKAIDKSAGAEREVVGRKKGVVSNGQGRYNWHAEGSEGNGGEFDLTVPATPEARRWEGWGTALKPAHEPIVVARKPLQGTVAGNVLVWGTGGLNIDGCRVGTDEDTARKPAVVADTAAPFGRGVAMGGNGHAAGRWPANVVFDRTAGEALDQQSGERPAGAFPKSSNVPAGTHYEGGWGPVDNGERRELDSGGASRFFTQADFGPDDWPFLYQAKPSKKERNAGLDGVEKRITNEITPPGTAGSNNPRAGANRSGASSNHHPTVKPIALMRWLVRMVTPPGGVVLEPFAGSGTTLVAAILEGFDAIGCEMTDEYLPIIEGRVAWAKREAAGENASVKPVKNTPAPKDKVAHSGSVEQATLNI
jgi:site-specific DNA-methyltransferase (adenine-specific)